MSEQKTLRELFSTTYFRIPDFQRGYAWTTKQLDDLWSDLDSLPEGARHYMGTLFVEREPGFKRAESDKWVEDDFFAEKPRCTPLYMRHGFGKIGALNLSTA